MRLEVAAAQIQVGWSIRDNLRRIAAAVRDAGHAQLLVLPEGAVSGYDPGLTGLDRLSPASIDDALEEVGRLASQHGRHVFCGSLAYEQGAWWNAAVHFSPAGVKTPYRKVNLANRERGRLAAAAELPIFPVELAADAITVGVQICRELRFPEQWHALARAGVQVFAYLTYATDPEVPEGVWRSHLISRAAELQRFVVAANVADPDQHCPTMIVSPTGEVLAEAELGRPGLIRSMIDLDAVSDWYLDQQRGDVVEIAYRSPTAGSDAAHAPLRLTAQPE